MDAIETTVVREGLCSGGVGDDGGDLTFFVDIFSCSQHRRDSAREAGQDMACPNMCDVGHFETVLAACSKLVFYATPVTKPLALGRVWCLFEVVKAHQLGLPIVVTFGQRDERILQSELLRSVTFMVRVRRGTRGMGGMGGAGDEAH